MDALGFGMEHFDAIGAWRDSDGRFAIDALKVSVPVWKREIWDGGSDWGTNAADLVDVSDVASPGSGSGSEPTS